MIDTQITSAKQSLLVYMGDGSTRDYPIGKSVIRIGRAPENDIVLVGKERSVSRSHAALTTDTLGALFIEDLNSANGTLVNGRPLKGKIRLKLQDMVSIGEFRLRLVEEAVEEAGFRVEAGEVELNELQQKPQLMSLAAKQVTDRSEFKHIELLYEVGITLARSHTVADVSNAAVELLFKIDQVHRAAVIQWDEKSNAFKSLNLHMRDAGAACAMPGAYDPTMLVMSRTMLSRVRQQNRPLLIRDAKSEDEGLDSALSIVRAGIQAAFCSPLTFKGRFLGILYADNLAEPDAFSDSDFRIFTTVAAQTGLALASALSSEELLQREVEKQALKRYLPPQVADLVIESGAEQLDGDLQNITVLYADIRGFTTMSERMEPREIVAMLREFFSSMSSVILKCNGTLDKFIGDCIMALFGAPVQSGQSVRDALKASILMQRKMQELNRDRAQQNEKPIQIGIGLHCGQAVVGNIGSEDRVQYTAIGDTVNVAARLVSKAAAGQIIVSEDIRNAVPDYPGFEGLGEVELKGRASKLNIFSIRWLEH